MKKGDIVTIKDNWHSRSVIGGGLIHEEDVLCKNEKYIVVETGCKFPFTHNNTVIQAIDSGRVMFINKPCLQLVEPTHKIMIDLGYPCGVLDGAIYEISDELYRKIKEEK